MNAAKMMTICMVYFSGSIQNSWKKSSLPSTSTGTQKTMTVAIAMRMLAPHEGKRSCLRNMKRLPIKHPAATIEVTG